MMETETPVGKGKSGGEADYFAPVTDLLLGILFIFLILLVFFASQLQTSSEALSDTIESRTELLSKLEARLAAQGVAAEIDADEGVLRLATSEMFPQGSSDLTPEGARLADLLAGVLIDELACYAWRSDGGALPDCRHPYHSLNTVAIEGHTDSDPITMTAWFKDNWDLSAARASTMYRTMAAVRPDMETLVNAPDGASPPRILFSIAGFADRHPVSFGDSAEDKARNRRIDIRLIMAPPSPVRLTPLPAFTPAANTERLPLGYNRRVQFGAGLSSAAYLGAGWWPPESWGVWAAEPEAQLILPLSEAPAGPLVFQLNGTGFVSENAPQRAFEVLIGPDVVDRFTLTYPQNVIAREIHLPAQSVAGQDALAVTLRAAELVSPQSVGVSTDPRGLGFGLTSLTLRRGR